MSEQSRRRFGGFLALSGAVMVLVGWLLWPDEDKRVLDWMPEIRQASAEAGIDPALLAGLVFAESRGQVNAVSSVGAMGLCQLMPPTAGELAEQMGIQGPPYSALDNLRMGATYLAKMQRKWDGDLDLAILSYRLGPARVRRQMEAAGGQEAYFAELQGKSPTPWAYRDQILEAQIRYAEMITTSEETPGSFDHD